MQTRRGSTLKGVITISLMVVNVVFWVPLLLVVALAKLIIPLAAWRRWTSALMIWIAQAWISCNGAIFSLMGALRLKVDGVEGLDPRSWYLVLSNHQSWVDILVLQKAFNRRIPFLKFFLKRELIWVPLIGMAWWALDFPFMRRGKTREAQRQDLETARAACEKFRHQPTSVMNFVEGTRVSAEKIASERSPYKHLLKPKVGGLSVALATMGEQFEALLDVTLVYPDGVPSFWDLLCGRLHAVSVHVQQREIPPQLLGMDAAGERARLVRLGRWLEQIWVEKDARIEATLQARS